MTTIDENDFSKVPLIALRTKTRCAISQMLNAIKVIPSLTTGLPRDWRGLAHIASTPVPPPNSCDPTGAVLDSWASSEATFQTLLQAFKDLDRWDVVYEITPIIESDASIYLKFGDSEQEVVADNVDVDKFILTVDDIQLTKRGLNPQIYDAFLLYSDADSDEAFAMEVVDKLENEYDLKLCLKNRDIVAGITFEHEAIMRLISERCRRLIIIVSPSFLDSPANKFFVAFAQAIGINKGVRKIIPCIYQLPHTGVKSLPEQLKYYHVLDYSRRSKLCDFWYKLSNSVRSIPATSVRENTHLESVRIEELPATSNNLAIDVRKPENWSSPEKSDNVAMDAKEENSALMKTDDNGNKLPVNTADDPKSSIIHSRFKKFIKGKSRPKGWFKKKKKQLALA